MAGTSGCDVSRAFDALTLDEEKHELLGHAFLVLAAASRLEQLRKGGVGAEAKEDEEEEEDVGEDKEDKEDEGKQEGELLKACAVLKSLREDLQRNCGTVASSEALADVEVARLLQLASEDQDLQDWHQGAEEVTNRAYNALTFAEEKYSILGKAHLVVALRCRREEMARGCGGEPVSPAFLEASSKFYRLSDELDDQLREGASAHVLGDREAMLMAMWANGREFEHLSAELREDPDIACAAFSTWAEVMPSASNAIRGNRDVIWKAALKDYKVLIQASPELKDDRDLLLAVITRCHPFGFNRASLRLRRDRELALAALAHCVGPSSASHILDHVGQNLLADREVMLQAMRADVDVLKYASQELWQDEDFMLRALRNSPGDPLKVVGTWCRHVSAHVLGAYESVLALAGEVWPIATIELGSIPASPAGTCSTQPTTGMTCIAIALSGMSFPCDLSAPDAADVNAPDEPINTFDDEGWFIRVDTYSEEPEEEPLPEVPTVAGLAKIVLEELPKHTQVEPPAQRVSLVFARNGDFEDVPVTPWDWNRPLTDFS